MFLGTICEHLNKSYGFHHLSAGELLRQEMKREGSQYGKLIHEINQAGKIVPSHITVGLLENEINKLSTSDQAICLIDGFPRFVTVDTLCNTKFVRLDPTGANKL